MESHSRRVRSNPDSVAKVVLLVVSVYLLKQDVARVIEADGSADERGTLPIGKLAG